MRDFKKKSRTTSEELALRKGRCVGVIDRGREGAKGEETKWIADFTQIVGFQVRRQQLKSALPPQGISYGKRPGASSVSAED